MPSLFTGASAACLSGGLLVQLSQAPGHDLSWLLIATERLVSGEGGALFVDPNPPLVLGLFAPAAAVAQAFDAPVVLCTRVYLMALAVGSLLVANGLLRPLLGAGASAARQALLVVVAFSYALWPGTVSGGWSFGQREHLMWMGLVPYLLALVGVQLGAGAPRRLQVVAGLAGGVAVALKPHYLLAIGALEVVAALRRRSLRLLWRPQTWAFGAVGVTYLAGLALAAPDYWTTTLPLTWYSYWIFQRPLADLTHARDVWTLLALLPALALLARSPRALEAGATGALAAVLFYVTMLVQGTGWRYHLLPFQGAALLVLALPAIAYLAAWQRDRFVAPLARGKAPLAVALAWALGMLALVLSPTVDGAIVREGAEWRAGGATGPVERFRRVIHQHADGGSVQILSPAMGFGFAAIHYADVGWCSRFGSLWLLPPVVRARDPAGGAPERLTAARVDAIERYLRDALIEDLERCRPALLLVDRAAHQLYGGVAFELAPWLRADPRFAEFWARYELAGQVGSFDAYARAPQ